MKLLPRNRHEWPIWKQEVEYEAVLRSSTSRRNYIRVSGDLYDFLTAYPKHREAKQFLVTHVEDYLESVKRERGEGAARNVYIALRAFFGWLKREKGLRHANPVTLKRHHRQRVATPLVELEQLTKLCKLADCGARDRQIVYGALSGQTRKELAQLVGLKPCSVSARFACLRAKAEFPPVPLRQLRAAYERLCMRLGARLASASLNFDVASAEALSNIPH